MRFLVTGADGFLGRYLVRGLVDNGWHVCALTRKPVFSRHDQIETFTFDLLDKSSLSLSPSKIGSIDGVFHLAALMPNAVYSSEKFIEGNGVATEILLAQCLQHSVKHFVYCSSIGVIGKPQYHPIDMRHPVNPLHPYFLGKLKGEQACRDTGTDITTHIFRLTSPYGASMRANSVLPLFIDRALDKQTLTWHGSGSRAQDFIYIDDVIRAFISTIGAKQSGEYCLGSGKATSMQQLAMYIASLFSGTALSTSGLDDPEEGVIWEADIKALARNLNFMPHVYLEEGLAKYLAALNKPVENWWLP